MSYDWAALRSVSDIIGLLGTRVEQMATAEESAPPSLVIVAAMNGGGSASRESPARMAWHVLMTLAVAVQSGNAAMLRGLSGAACHLMKVATDQELQCRRIASSAKAH